MTLSHSLRNISVLNNKGNARMSSSGFLSLSTVIALASTLAALPLHAQTAFPATLAGHVVLPATSFIAAPEDASEDLKISGKFTTGKRVDAIGYG